MTNQGRDRRANLEFAISENRRKRRLDELRELIARTEGLEHFELVGLETSRSDSLREEFHRTLEACRADQSLVQLGSLSRDDFIREAGRVVDSFSDAETLWIMLFRWKDAGALRTHAMDLAKCFAQLLDLDGDTVFGGTEQGNRIFLFDYILDGDYYEILSCDT